MTALPVSGYIETASRTTAQIKQALEDLRDVISELVGGAASSELTIASGAVTPISAVHTIDTESDASSDDLTNIDVTNMPAGRFLLISAANDARTVVVKHEAGGSGQVSLVDGADFSIDDDDKALLLVLIGTTWVEVYRKNDVRSNTIYPVSGTSVIVNGVYIDTADASISKNGLLLRARTSDGSDSSYVVLSGGGASGNTRGAAFAVYGNEHGTYPGGAQVNLGNVSGAAFSVYSDGGTKRFEIVHGGTATVAYTGSYSKPQRSPAVAAASGTFDMNAAQNFTCIPTGAVTLQFSNETAGQSGLIMLYNSSPYTISLGAEVYGDANMASDLTNAGWFEISYYCWDGTNVAVSYTAALT